MICNVLIAPRRRERSLANCTSSRNWSRRSCQRQKSELDARRCGVRGSCPFRLPSERRRASAKSHGAPPRQAIESEARLVRRRSSSRGTGERDRSKPPPQSALPTPKLYTMASAAGKRRGELPIPNPVPGRDQRYRRLAPFDKRVVAARNHTSAQDTPAVFGRSPHRTALLKAPAVQRQHPPAIKSALPRGFSTTDRSARNNQMPPGRP